MIEEHKRIGLDTCRLANPISFAILLLRLLVSSIRLPFALIGHPGSSANRPQRCRLGQVANFGFGCRLLIFLYVLIPTVSTNLFDTLSSSIEPLLWAAETLIGGVSGLFFKKRSPPSKQPSYKLTSYYEPPILSLPKRLDGEWLVGAIMNPCCSSWPALE